MLVTYTRQESYESRHKIEDITYENLPETRIIVVKDGLVIFCQHFKYLGSCISFSLQYDQDIAKGLAVTNDLMGAMYKICEDDHVYAYSKYLIFKAIPCNLLL